MRVIQMLSDPDVDYLPLWEAKLMKQKQQISEQKNEICFERYGVTGLTSLTFERRCVRWFSLQEISLFFKGLGFVLVFNKSRFSLQYYDAIKMQKNSAVAAFWTTL